MAIVEDEVRNGSEEENEIEVVVDEDDGDQDSDDSDVSIFNARRKVTVTYLPVFYTKKKYIF